jgi:hypothetical protein
MELGGTEVNRRVTPDSIHETPNPFTHRTKPLSQSHNSKSPHAITIYKTGVGFLVGVYVFRFGFHKQLLSFFLRVQILPLGDFD